MHTKTPVRLAQDTKRFIIDADGDIIAEIWHKGNPAEIVNCVNSHQGLMEAVERFITLLADSQIPSTIREQAKASLKAAGVTV